MEEMTIYAEDYQGRSKELIKRRMTEAKRNNQIWLRKIDVQDFTEIKRGQLDSQKGKDWCYA